MFRKPTPEYASVRPVDTTLSLSAETQSVEKKPRGPVAESKWGIGLRTVSLMVFFFVSAILIGVAHLIVFLKLDGKLTDGPGIPPQTYVAAISTFLVNAFGTSLVVSLGFAFTQCLWRAFRAKSMPVRTVETLYGIRLRPLLLFDWTAWAAAPLLCFMASTMFLLAIVRIFPPGALTIVSRDLVNATDSTVPTFKSDYIGNFSISDAKSHAINDYGISTSLWKYKALHPALRKVAYATLTTGEVITGLSPCGANCSYGLSFEGPYFSCTNFTEESMRMPDSRPPVETPVFRHFSAGWSRWDLEVPWLENIVQGEAKSGDATFPSLYLNLSLPLGFVDENDTSVVRLVTQTSNLKCEPAAVTYDLNVTYENGVRTLSYSTRDDIRLLADIYVTYTTPPGKWNDSTSIPQNWTEKHLANYRVMNLYALTDSVAEALTGTYPMYADSKNDKSLQQEITLTNGTKVVILPATISFGRTHSQSSRPNGTVIAVTHFNKNLNSFNVSSQIELDISAQILNELLGNVTLSAIHAFPYWDTTANVTRWTARNFYSFSNPKNLFAPYGASLLVTLPFLVLGIVALCQNGVSAMDGSFLQILMTTASSKGLNEAAASGCLGGEENIPTHLKDKRIRFGELVTGEPPSYNTENTPVRRAGFGFEDEIAPLRKRGRYGAE